MLSPRVMGRLSSPAFFFEVFFDVVPATKESGVAEP
jgi:hypothetical protein